MRSGPFSHCVSPRTELQLCRVVCVLAFALRRSHSRVQSRTTWRVILAQTRKAPNLAPKRIGRPGKRSFTGLFFLLLAGTIYAGLTWLQHPSGTSYASGIAHHAAINVGAYPAASGTPAPSPTC